MYNVHTTPCMTFAYNIKKNIPTIVLNYNMTITYTLDYYVDIILYINGFNRLMV